MNEKPKSLCAKGLQSDSLLAKLCKTKSLFGFAGSTRSGRVWGEVSYEHRNHFPLLPFPVHAKTHFDVFFAEPPQSPQAPMIVLGHLRPADPDRLIYADVGCDWVMESEALLTNMGGSKIWSIAINGNVEVWKGWEGLGRAWLLSTYNDMRIYMMCMYVRT